MDSLAVLIAALDRALTEVAPVAAGDRVVVAFSGGPDSTALALGVARLAAARGFTAVAAHLDHGLDPGSAARAAAAGELARALALPFVGERREVVAFAAPGESREAAARRVRYAFLEEVRERLGARWVLTGHHRDDQAETVALRLLFGSGLEGLAAIRPRHGRVARPLLEVPRAALLGAVAAAPELAGLPPVADPTNADLAVPRNRVRHRLLPALAVEEPEVPVLLARLALAARRAGGRLERLVTSRLAVRDLAGGGVEVEREGLARLPPELLPFALAALDRRAGTPWPAGRAALAELSRQVAAAGRIGCDRGGGWRWEGKPGRPLRLVRRAPSPPPLFAYTLVIPGVLDIPELGLAVAISRGTVAPWMFRGARSRAGLALPLAAGDRVVVRSRRPGDRIRPLGASGSRRLKEVLIDRGVPREERDRLPLLCVGERGERIAWVPGVTIDERFRLRAGPGAPHGSGDGDESAWIAAVTAR